MSCSWDIVCVDCREHAGIDNANHADELMRILIRHQRAIAAVSMGELGATDPVRCGFASHSRRKSVESARAAMIFFAMLSAGNRPQG